MSEVTKDQDNNEKRPNEDYESLLDQYQFSVKEMTPGKLMRGRVIKVTPSHVLVDVGFKSEGMIPIEDFEGFQDPGKLRPGDEIDAILERTDHKDG